jgi:hypothetical protein
MFRLTRFDLPEITFALRFRQVIGLLEIEPELARGAKMNAETNGRVG